MTHFRKGFVEKVNSNPNSPLMRQLLTHYDFCSRSPKTRFRRERDPTSFIFHLFGENLTYEEAKKQLDSRSKFARLNAVRRIIQEYNLELTQRMELDVAQHRGHSISGFIASVTYPVPILVANSSISRIGYQRITENPGHYASLSRPNFETQYPDRYDAIATLENIASTSTHPELRRMARESILDSDVLLRLAISSTYEDTAIHAAQILGLYVREASHWIGMSSDRSLRRSTPLHLIECSDFNFVYKAEKLQYGNVFEQELNAALTSIQNTRVLIAFLGSLYPMGRKPGFRQKINEGSITDLLKRKPDLSLVQQLERIVERWIKNGADNTEKSVQAIIDGLKATEKGIEIFNAIGKRLAALYNCGAAISRQIRKREDEITTERFRGEGDFGGGAEYGYAPSGYLGDSGWRSSI
jgi:hypothetical protein